ncbi:UDP-N-acetylmuramate--L-alanine ligase [Prolixibacter denitrificans]|uniref:UDP-N-acetylmuramate--L-alanine ligase n=1 Tax=Prolixibacter denitrificans TaxID=1541063 RepID=A0A2P8CIL1_9BACT|nr:UDP-N-acetylmuramate--L-alanine ligase [Prolixibacter denitrificans]PSK84772.1 UDP-N-acetylmuramate--alanine ligase [Prolixibacter denitrificans]GET20937.1 UDP-N-acetylmuramate--L-alanine ligase [Prolixibacter denitrificans]
MNLEKVHRVYLLGIGGIGMSALARYFRFHGMRVEGYDRTETELTRELEEEGIYVHYEADLKYVPPFNALDNTLVIYTPAIPESNIELQFFRKTGTAIYKRSQVLGIIAAESQCIAVSGTHGKTSVTTMTAHLLHQSSVGCTSFMGGISRNYHTNLILPEKETNVVVAEADEFDRSFLRLFPQRAVITSIDPDHLDIYGDFSHLLDAFKSFVGQVNKCGEVLYKKGLPVEAAWNEEAKFYTYSIKGKADFYGTNIRVEDGAYHFDLVTPFGEFADLRLAYPGLMNVENAVAACGLALLSGVTGDEIREALASYVGVVRRFDIRFRGKKVVYIDDYAHHPKELEATIHSVQDMFPDKKVTGIFQPHLYSRTRDLAEDFTASLSLLDELILLDIYPAREEPIPGVDSQLILEKVTIKDKILCHKEELPEVVEKLETGVLLTLGAGDIDQWVEPIVEVLKKKEDV